MHSTNRSHYYINRRAAHRAHLALVRRGEYRAAHEILRGLQRGRCEFGLSSDAAEDELIEQGAIMRNSYDGNWARCWFAPMR